MVRRVGLALGALLAAVVLAPVPGTGAQAGGGVRADAEGWWNTAPTDVPVTIPPVGVAVPADPPAPDVPEGAIAIGTRLGQPARVAALGIVLDAAPGSTVGRLVLRLREAEGPFAQQGSTPAVRACPITSFLVPEMNGAPTNVPDADCGAGAATGQRGDDGTWTFDLTPIAAAWLDPFGSLDPNGIRLDPVGEPPATFQVAFMGVEGATFDADITPPADSGADPFAVGGGGGAFGTDTGSAFDPGSGASAEIATPTPLAPEAPAVEAPAERAASAPEVVEEIVESRAGHTFGNWPASTVLALFVALLLALAVAVVLGPAGRERPDLARRPGGVRRALAGRIDAPAHH